MPGTPGTRPRLTGWTSVLCSLHRVSTVLQVFANIMEPLEEDEPNSFQVKVDRSMTRTEVVDQILRQIQ